MRLKIVFLCSVGGAETKGTRGCNVFLLSCVLIAFPNDKNLFSIALVVHVS